MRTSDEERLTRWFDGELEDDAVADLLARDPGLTEEKANAVRIQGLLREALHAEEKVPHADFFNAEVLRRVEAESDAEAGLVRWSDEAEVFPRFTRFRVASALGFAAALVAMVAHTLSRPPADRSEVVNAFTPDPEVSATAEYHRSAEATVIRLTGLPEVPAGDGLHGMEMAPGRVVFSLHPMHASHTVHALADDPASLPGYLMVDI